MAKPNVFNEPVFLDGLRRGEEDAWEQLYHGIQSSLHIFILVELHHQSVLNYEARDILQEAFSRAYQHIGEFQGKSKIETWIYGIAQNFVKSLHQKTKRRHDKINESPHYSQLIETLYLPDRFSTPEHVSISHELLEIIIAEIDTLPPDDRCMIVKRYLGECTVPKIAKQSNLPAKRVEHRLEKIRNALKKRLVDFWGV